MSKLIIHGANVVTPNGVLEKGVVVCDGSFFADVKASRGWTGPADAQVVDGRGLTLLPGFLDVHIHGGGGHDTMDAKAEALRAICRTHAKYGTVGLLLTTMTQSRDAIANVLHAAREAWQAGPDFCPNGAQALGVHVEGPYISPKRPGAQPTQFVRPYHAEEWADWLRIAGGAIKLTTVAPEMPHADALIHACREANVVVSMGHTDADAVQTQTALSLGVSHATHLFNAMPPIHHRTPGPIPVLLTDERANVEIIADGHHVAPEVVRMIVKAKGADKVILVTDAMAGAGAGDGAYELGGNPVTVANGKATLADGTLAGSVLTMAQAARNVRDWTGADLPALARMTATNAADEMGWTKRGRIVPDCYADFVLVNDAFDVQATYVAGRCVYRV